MRRNCGNSLRKPEISVFICFTEKHSRSRQLLEKGMKEQNMQIQTEGFVIKETNVGENDKYITVLTLKLGTIECYVKSARRKGSRFLPSTGVFCYSSFVLFYNKSKYYVDHADIINMFYDIRLDVVRLSLASYICQILYEIKPDRDTCKEILRLSLNSMHLLANTKKDYRTVKSVFELRCMSQSGFCPDLVACKNCSTSDTDMFFYINGGYILCKDCADENASGYVRLTHGVLDAMRHIIYSLPEKVFSFTLDNDNLKLLSEVCEAYLIWQTERSYKTLNFLKTMTE